MKALEYLLTPFLFTTYAFLSLLVNNITEVNLSALTALLISTLIAGLVLILIRVFVHDAEKASIIATVGVVLIFSFGHIANLLAGFFSANLLFVVWLGVFVGGGFWVLSKAQPQRLASISKYMRTVGIVLLVFPIYNLLSFGVFVNQLGEKADRYVAQNFAVDDVTTDLIAESAEAMDIYYIVLDSYVRADSLENELGYDNSAMIDFLEEQGFYVATASRSNYTNTRLSVSSSLNMSHIANLPEVLDGGAQYQKKWMLEKATAFLITNNLVAKNLQDEGYEFVTFNTGFEKVELTDADHYMISPNISGAGKAAESFNLLLFNTTIGRFLDQNVEGNSLQSLADSHRERIQYTLAHVSDFADQPGSYFTYAHLISPHAPFIFNKQGGFSNECLYPDAVAGAENDLACYVGQITGLNELVKQAVLDILEKSDSPPIIIIQADHGVNCSVESDIIEERVPLCFPILNAYFFPDGDYTRLYPDITPVNTFRIVLDQYFGADLPLLPDRSYFYETIEGNDQFVDICEIYDYCP